MLEIYCDGASRGNPGKAAYAFIIIGGGMHCGELDENTNNVAEYLSIINAMNYVCGGNPQRGTDLTIYSDSELVIKQLNAEYQIKNNKLKLMSQIIGRQKYNFRSVDFVWVSRDDPNIKIADSLCNMILDKARMI
jgi:ribonuclease HI